VKRDWAALALAMSFPSILTWIYFVELGARSEEPGLAARVVFAVGKTVQFSIPLLYCLRYRRDMLGPSAPTRRGLLLGILFGLGVDAGMLALYHFWLWDTQLIEVGRRAILRQVQKLGLGTPANFLAFTAFVALLHSLLEEYYFRWFIFGLLRRHTRLWVAVAVSSVAFMAHHVILLAVYFPGGAEFVLAVVLFSLCVAVGGAFWAWLYDRSGSLYAPWVSHLLIDAGIMVVGYELVGAYLTR
jgi:membrane protease YdiL (CAAX protease family)